MNTVRGAWWVVVPLVILAFGLPGRVEAQEDEDMGIALGATPSPVTIQDLDGHPADLGATVGKKPMLVEFWATWCPRCAALMPKLDSAYARYGGKVEFVAIAVAVNESPASVKRHLAKDPAPFRFLWDATGGAVRAFQAPATSYVVLLDGKGRVVYTGLGEEQDLDAALQKVVGDGRGR